MAERIRFEGGPKDGQEWTSETPFHPKICVPVTPRGTKQPDLDLLAVYDRRESPDPERWTAVYVCRNARELYRAMQRGGTGDI